MRVKLVPETKPEEMNESQWTSRRGSRPALRTTSFALPYCDSRHDGLIRLAPALKGRLARYHARRSRVGARTYRPRRRMIAQLIEGKECAGTWRVLPTMSAASRRRNASVDSARHFAQTTTSNEKWFHSSRLVTRTKEPSIPESIDVMKTSMRNESDDEKRIRARARARRCTFYRFWS